MPHRAINIPLVTIVILNWNGESLLQECFDSLFKLEYPNIEILLVDNGSTDRSLELAKRFPQIIICKNTTNLGYAAGNNAGFKIANGKYVATLNNDVIVDPKWLNDPIATLEKSKDIGIISCRQMNYYKPEFIDSLFGHPSKSILFSPVGRDKKFSENPSFNTAKFVFAANGGSAIYRHELIKSLNGFDEIYFAYHEESDLCMRAFYKGWKCLYLPSSVVYHKISASFNRRKGLAFYFTERNRALFLIKLIPSKIIFSHLGPLFIEEIKTWLSSIKHLYFLEFIKARFAAIRLIPYALKMRNVILLDYPKHNKRFLELWKEEKTS